MTTPTTIPATDRPHYAFVVMTSDGYWGRGHTEDEARAQARAAGARLSRKGIKVKVIECPDNVRDAEIDSTGAICYFMIDDEGPSYTVR